MTSTINEGLLRAFVLKKILSGVDIWAASRLPRLPGSNVFTDCILPSQVDSRQPPVYSPSHCLYSHSLLVSWSGLKYHSISAVVTGCNSGGFSNHISWLYRSLFFGELALTAVIVPMFSISIFNFGTVYWLQLNSEVLFFTVYLPFVVVLWLWSKYSLFYQNAS